MKIPRKVGKRDEKEMVSSFTCRNDDGSGSLERHKKKSFDFYRRVIDTNGGII